MQVPGDNGGKRTYPQGLALILGLVGGIGVGTLLRGSAPNKPKFQQAGLSVRASFDLLVSCN